MKIKWVNFQSIWFDNAIIAGTKGFQSILKAFFFLIERSLERSFILLTYCAQLENQKD